MRRIVRPRAKLYQEYKLTTRTHTILSLHLKDPDPTLGLAVVLPTSERLTDRKI